MIFFMCMYVHFYVCRHTSECSQRQHPDVKKVGIAVFAGDGKKRGSVSKDARVKAQHLAVSAIVTLGSLISLYLSFLVSKNGHKNKF